MRVWSSLLLLALSGLSLAERNQPLAQSAATLEASPGRRQRAKDLDATGAPCNNSPILCERSYSNITHLGAHDSAFVANAANAYTISGNQFFDAKTQLDAGVRLLTAQIHTIPDQGIELRLCHTDCSLYDGGTLIDWLAGINSWMDANPNDVVTLLFVNSENANAQRLNAAFKASGINKYSYTPASKGPQTTWPTLAAMIKANTRLVTYIASLGDNTAAPYMLDEFAYVFENPFEVTAFANFTAVPDRPTSLQGKSQQAIDSGRLFLMNHFLDRVQILNIVVPDRDNAARTNSPDPSVLGSLGDAMTKAVQLYQKPPNYVLVDWFNAGPAMATIDGYNGVSKPMGRKDVPTDIFSSTPAVQGGVERSVEGAKMAILLAVLFMIISF
jgi:hypothetical protein